MNIPAAISLICLSASATFAQELPAPTPPPTFPCAPGWQRIPNGGCERRTSAADTTTTPTGGAQPALAQSTVPSYTKSVSATKRIRTAYGHFTVWIDGTKWTQTKKTVTNKEGRLEFVKGLTLIQVITEPTVVPTDLIPEAALEEFRKVAGDARIVSTERRSVNGRHILSVHFLLTASSSTLRVYCYFYGGTSGTIRLIGITPESIADQEAGDITDFLNGIEISDQEQAQSDSAQDLPAVGGAASAPTRAPTKQERLRLKREQEAAQRAAKAQKKMEDEARANLPTQSDIIEGCIAVRNIVFKPAQRGLFADHAQLTGTISNSCGRQAEVSFSVSFYSASGDFMDFTAVVKLVPSGDTPFWTGPEYYSDAAFLAKAGKVTSVMQHTF